MFHQIHFILYVKNQEKSKQFYRQLLQLDPVLDVSGMTEFNLDKHTKLGLMPERSIVKILKDKVPSPADGNGIPRCELYLKVNDAATYMNRGISLGAIQVSNLQSRDWGDKVGYLSDVDGNIIAFAE